MERDVASAPPPAMSRPAVSPLSLSSPASLTSFGPVPPFSAIRSTSDGIREAPVGDEMLSERDLIARGRMLLKAYQTQKKQWLSGVPESDLDSEVNIFQNDALASPAAGSMDAPSIDTKLDHLLLPPPPPPSTFMSGLSTFSIGPTPTSQLKMHEPGTGGAKTSEKSWTDFMQLLKTNGQMMDEVDEQLAEIWGQLVAADEHARGRQTSVEKLSEAVTQLLQQKREAELAISKLAEVLGSRVFLTGKLTDDAVQFVSNQLKMELGAAQAMVEQVKDEKDGYLQEFAAGRASNGSGRSAEIEKLLRQQLQDKDEQLKASQAAVAKLRAQLDQQKETDANKLTMFEKALGVKLREVEALCSDIEMPATHERFKTTEGVTCFRRKGKEEENQLEDPRVPLALERAASVSNVSSARPADVDAAPSSNDITSSGSTQRPRRVSTIARDYAAPDNMMRRSFSTPHISHDSNALEDIHVPPDDGRKHTIEDFSTPLPAGWEMRVTASGAVFFFNKYTTTTTWTDPRLLGATPTSAASMENGHTQAQQKMDVRNSSITTTESRPSRANSAVPVDRPQSPTAHTGNDITFFDVVFNERGPIGIHFQANIPDAGATVRSLLPDMAAASKGVLEPFDELVAVNKNAVDAAPFRHVMLLLQGGLRPLTLTFKRDPNRPPRPMSPLAAPMSDSGVSSVSELSDVHPDEEVVVDEGMVVDLDQLRVPTEPQPQSQGQTEPATANPDEDEDMNVADVIITNIFSLFWKPPETTGEVQTV